MGLYPIQINGMEWNEWLAYMQGGSKK